MILTKIGQLLGDGQKIRISVETEFYKLDSSDTIVSRFLGTKNNSTDILQVLTDQLEILKIKLVNSHPMALDGYW